MLLCGGQLAACGTWEAERARAMEKKNASLRWRRLQLFEAAAMQTDKKDLRGMLVRELKEELEARGAPKTGNNQQGVRWLCRRLHLGAIVRAHMALWLVRMNI